jgi:hypothetical protein
MSEHLNLVLLGAHPVAGGGRVTSFRSRHTDGRVTIDSFFYGPDGDFRGVTQMDVTPRPMSSPVTDPATNVRAALKYIQNRYEGSWGSGSN